MHISLSNALWAYKGCKENFFCIDCTPPPPTHPPTKKISAKFSKLYYFSHCTSFILLFNIASMVTDTTYHKYVASSSLTLSLFSVHAAARVVLNNLTYFRYIQKFQSVFALFAPPSTPPPLIANTFKYFLV